MREELERETKRLNSEMQSLQVKHNQEKMNLEHDLKKSQQETNELKLKLSAQVASSSNQKATLEKEKQLLEEELKALKKPVDQYNSLSLAVENGNK
jgi:hypothetical protein